MAGRLAVISGFSGAGKGTVVRRLLQAHEGYVLSVSWTTRTRRETEEDGVDYHFVTDQAFEALVAEDGFLEHAGYAGCYYGTPRAFVEKNLEAGRDVLLEIEVQGAMQIREKFPDAVLIFVAPPDAEELERRLVGRGTDSEETITRRLRRGIEEAGMIPDYPYFVCNDEVDACARSVHAIIQGLPCPDSAAGRVTTDRAQKEALARAFQEALPLILQKRE